MVGACDDQIGLLEETCRPAVVGYFRKAADCQVKIVFAKFLEGRARPACETQGKPGRWRSTGKQRYQWLRKQRSHEVVCRDPEEPAAGKRIEFGGSADDRPSEAQDRVHFRR